MEKFNTLLESVFGQYQRGNFRAGDIVKFRGNANSHDWFKGLAENKLEIVKAMMEGDLNLRVCAVKAEHGIMGQAHGDPSMEVGPWHVDLVQEIAPGRYHNFLTVPEDMLENLDTGINRAPVPDSMKKDDPSHINLTEVEDDPDKVRADQTKSDCMHRNLGDQNVQLTGATAANSYTGKYLDKTGIQPG